MLNVRYGLFGCVFSCHNQRIRSAKDITSRFRMPSPPYCIGLVTRSHDTEQWPPWSSLCPRHRKDLLHLSIALINHFGRSRAMSRRTGIAVNTALTRMRRSEVAMRVAFHPGSISATLSMYGCKSVFVRHFVESGRPRYLHGKSTSVQSIICCACWTTSWSHLIGSYPVATLPGCSVFNCRTWV